MYNICLVKTFIPVTTKIDRELIGTTPEGKSITFVVPKGTKFLLDCQNKFGTTGKIQLDENHEYPASYSSIPIPQNTSEEAGILIAFPPETQLKLFGIPVKIETYMAVWIAYSFNVVLLEGTWLMFEYDGVKMFSQTMPNQEIVLHVPCEKKYLWDA